ncbi:Cof-type HAD-IIB family hydrolase [Candidatus Enterococcus ferrettii]|uniref:HAD superfamily hydrolase n=1 Tax=Candidatus Enterococcus ferrettii TaxID=2815324 RepID=A0ABV0EWN8_9ENTE|nr:Cof-type HAD-IIB family hydrolase [Enterococcus sp. 665A]MBO1339380.1 HAD family phosphatase [Enterococcus sp. 665A]
MKLAAIDLDGTLLNHLGEIPKKNQEALQTFNQQGGTIVLATGRSILSVKKVFAQLSIDGYVLASNGAYIAKVEKGETTSVLKRFDIPAKTINQAFHLAEQIGVTIVASRETQDDRITFDASPVEVDSPYYAQFQLQDSSTEELLKKINDGSLNYFKLAFNDTDVDKLAVLRKMFESAGIPSVYTDIHWLEIMADGVNKGTSLTFLADYLQIDPEEVVAFGDQENDIEMLKVSGVGVAMDNALEPVKAIAQQVTTSNEEAGVAEVLEEYL